MRKSAGLLTSLAMTIALSGAALAANNQKIVLKAPQGGNKTGKFAYVQVGSPSNPKLAQFKAQNHLSAQMNKTLVQQRQGANFKNGTIDTVPYFNSSFITGGRNSIYAYSMVGQTPQAGGTTWIDNRILPLQVQLTDFNGNVLYDFNPTVATDKPGDDVSLTAQSPLYDATTTYPGPPADTGQIVDTAQRVEFRSVRAANWHTPLNTPQLNSYYYGVKLDPTAWVYLVNGQNQVVGVAMDINVISSVFEQLLQVENSITPLPNSVVPIILTDFLTAYDPFGGCCVLGYHTAETGIVNPNGILAWTWSTYIPHNPDNGFSNPFGAFGFDVMVLSHELSELYNDPFVNTNVSPWVDGSVSFAQANLETGDVIEDMATADVIYKVPLNPNGKPYTYRLQNVATLEWFTRNPFNGGIYSWPNEHTLDQAPHLTGGCASGPTWAYGQGSGGFYFCNSNTGW